MFSFRRQAAPVSIRAVPAAIAAASAMLAGAVSVSTAVAPARAATDTRPNIILIVADDMARSDLRWMPKTRRLLGQYGVTMENFLSNHPLCCPARAEILSGQYAQNNGTWHNGGPWGGSNSFRYHGSSLGAWLKASGYRTAYIGKYLNQWEGYQYIPRGWTSFNALSNGIYRPYDFTSINNGSPVRHTNVYTADWIARQARSYINTYSRTGNPFFIYAAHVPPHDMRRNATWVPPIPAPRHRDDLPDVVSPSIRKPSFNVETRLSNRGLSVDEANWRHARRVRSLLSVDEATAKIVDALVDNRELRNTYIVFTSDNGYLLGEHRIIGKDVPYEEALRVPLLVRGPNLPDGAVRTAMGSMVDLAPTLARIARATPSRELDGRSLLRLWREGANAGNRTTLIQSGAGERIWDWRGVRTHRHTYVIFHDGQEMLFDRTVDPYELENHAESQPDALDGLRARYAALKDCAGSACVTASQ